MNGAEAYRRAARLIAACALLALAAGCATPGGGNAGGGGATAPASSSSAGRPTLEVVSVTGASVNLRAGPGTRHAVVGGVRRGERLEVLARRGGWLEVRRGGGSAWIARSLTGDPDATQRAPDTADEPENPLMAPPPPAEDADEDDAPAPFEVLEESGEAPGPTTDTAPEATLTSPEAPPTRTASDATVEPPNF